jgi:hypothetical protein
MRRTCGVPHESSEKQVNYVGPALVESTTHTEGHDYPRGECRFEEGLVLREPAIVDD